MEYPPGTVDSRDQQAEIEEISDESEVCNEDMRFSPPKLFLHNKLLTNLYLQKVNETFCDVQFVCGDTCVCVHACVLASFSTYINNLLTSREQPFAKEFSVDKPMKIQLNLDVEKESNESVVACLACTSKVVNFLYVGKIHLEREHLRHVRCIARILCIEVLLTICDRYDDDYKETESNGRHLQPGLKRKAKLNLHPKNRIEQKITNIMCQQDVTNNRSVIVLSEAPSNISVTSCSLSANNDSGLETSQLIQPNQYPPDTHQNPPHDPPINSDGISTFCRGAVNDASVISNTNEMDTSSSEHEVPASRGSKELSEFSKAYTGLMSCGTYKNLLLKNQSPGKIVGFINRTKCDNIANEIDSIDLQVQIARNRPRKSTSSLHRIPQGKAERMPYYLNYSESGPNYKVSREKELRNRRLTQRLVSDKCNQCGGKLKPIQESKIDGYQMPNLQCTACNLKNKRDKLKTYCNDKEHLSETEAARDFGCNDTQFNYDQTNGSVSPKNNVETQRENQNLFITQFKSSVNLNEAKKGSEVEMNCENICLDSELSNRMLVTDTDVHTEDHCRENLLFRASDSTSVAVLPSEIVVQRLNSGSKMYFCNVCNFSTNRVKKLLCHLEYLDHGEETCSLCDFQCGSNDALKEHLERHNDRRPFFCDHCGCRYNTPSALKSHLVKHSLESSEFHCAICKRGFKRKQFLQTHLLTHSDKKKHLCNQCGFKTVRLMTLKNHKLKHSGRDLMCPELGCNYKTAVENKLKEHKLLHTREKKLKCDVCGDMFAVQRYLNRHKNTMHGLHSFSCLYCAYESKRSDKLREHVMSKHKSRENVQSKSFAVDISPICQNDLISSKNNRLLNKFYSDGNLRNESGVHESEISMTSVTNISDKVFQLENNCVRDCMNSCSGKVKSNEPREKSQNGLCKLCNQSLPLDCEVDQHSMLHLNNFSSLDRNQALVLNESTGELSIVNIGSDEPTMSTVTLNETTGLLTLNINRDATSAVFLNESTGEMSYVNLNKENNGELSLSNTMNGSSSTLILNESTGALIYSEQIDRQNFEGEEATGEIEFEPGSNVELQLPWDDFEIGDWLDNEDSLDGFFFDKSNSLFPLHDFDNDCDLTAFLNECTGELVMSEGCQSFTDKIGDNAHSESTVTLDESTGQLMFSDPLISCPRIWVLNECTGELSAQNQSKDTWINNQGGSSSDAFAISGERAEQLFDALSEKSMDSFNQ